MRFLSKKRPNQNDDLRKLEKQLMTNLQPVFPRAEFVRELGAKLADKEIITTPKLLISKKVSNGLLVAGGVVGSLIMIITSIRGLISIIGIVGYLIQFLNRDSQGQHTSPA
jgi:hypothetical protein